MRRSDKNTAASTSYHLHTSTDVGKRDYFLPIFSVAGCIDDMIDSPVVSLGHFGMMRNRTLFVASAAEHPPMPERGHSFLAVLCFSAISAISAVY
jgi:hypothetical protein